MDSQLTEKQTFQILSYQEEHAEAWDELVIQAPMATFMHTRKFIAYHGTRFQDASLLLRDPKNKLVAVFPAALAPNDSTCVINHPGLSYGGILHSGSLRGEKMMVALQGIQEFYKNQGAVTLRYKAIPAIYHQLPASDDLYALFRLGAHRYRCDLASTIDVMNRPPLESKRRWEIQQALKRGLQIHEGSEYAASLWRILQENLSRKHQAQPVHSLEEIQRLAQLFPENIQFIVGLLDHQMVAGLVLFISSQVVHAQYIASSPEGYEHYALYPIIEHCIQKTKQLGCRYFDFGISTEQDGQFLNTGLFQFKSKFGASGSLCEFYELTL